LGFRDSARVSERGARKARRRRAMAVFVDRRMSGLLAWG
jgi:hypothetical protein